MSDEKIVSAADEIQAVEEADKSAKKSGKPAQKKPNAFVRIWKKFVKLCKDTVGEMKKVVWTPKAELKKNSKLVIVTCIAFALAVAIVDTAFSYLINTVAGLLG